MCFIITAILKVLQLSVVTPSEYSTDLPIQTCVLVTKTNDNILWGLSEVLEPEFQLTVNIILDISLLHYLQTTIILHY